MYSDSVDRANSVDPDDMPQKAASHQELHGFPLLQQFFDTTSGSNCTYSNFRTSMERSLGVHILRVITVTFTAALWVKFSADDILEIFFLIFPRKQDMTFHANCFLRRQFA